MNVIVKEAPYTEHWIHPQCADYTTDTIIERDGQRLARTGMASGVSCYRCGKPGVGPIHPIIYKYEVREKERIGEEINK